MHKLPQTIDEVIEVLDNIIDDNVLHKNYNAVFAYVYRRTTIEIKKAIERGVFKDAKGMEKFDVYFANLYIKAYYNYREKVPLSISCYGSRHKAYKWWCNEWLRAFSKNDKKL